MAQDNEEEFDDSVIPEDDDLEKQEAPRARGRPMGTVKKQGPSPIPNAAKPSLPYSAVHIAQLDGMIDNARQKIIAADIWDMLVIIKNDLEEIKRSLTG